MGDRSMKRKITGITLLLITVVLISMIQSFAQPGDSIIPGERLLPRLVDDANLLTDDEAISLLARLDEISERQRLDIIIITVGSLGNKTPTEYADDFFNYNGYGMGEDNDGVLFLLSMEERDWAISTTGYGITVFTDAGQEYIVGQIIDDLGGGKYYKAFNRFVDLCDEFIAEARTDKPFDYNDIQNKSAGFNDMQNRPSNYNNMSREPLGIKWIFISLAGGVIIALIVTGIMKSNLKTVRMQAAATNYIKPGSMNLTGGQDLFLYSTVDKRPRPKKEEALPRGPGSGSGSSTHTSSSGRSHGGSSGKF